MGIYDKIFKPNIEKLKENEDVDGLINALKHKNVDIQEKAVKALGEIGEPAVEPLLQALDEEDWYVRRAAVMALGEVGGARALTPLIKALKDNESVVRGAAVEAFGIIGEPAVEPLLQALDEEDCHVRAAAVRALGEVGGARALTPLIKALKDNDSGVRYGAAVYLGEMGDASAVAPLILALKDNDSEVRYRAAVSLGEMGDASAVAPLIKAFDKIFLPGIFTKHVVLEALEEIGKTTNKYFCFLCDKELKGKEWEFVKKREIDNRYFINDVYKPEVPSRISNMWELKNRIFYCKDCILESENWMEQDKVCINCEFFMMNYVQLPNIGDFYCRTNKFIFKPLKDTCLNWKLAELFISE